VNGKPDTCRHSFLMKHLRVPFLSGEANGIEFLAFSWGKSNLTNVVWKGNDDDGDVGSERFFQLFSFRIISYFNVARKCSLLFCFGESPTPIVPSYVFSLWKA